MKVHFFGVLAVALLLCLVLPSAGTAQWQPNGLKAHLTELDYPNTGSVSTLDGGVLIVYEESYNNLRASKYDSLGYLVWVTASNINPPGTSVGHVTAFPDGAGGAIAVWTSSNTLADEVIRAQRIDGATGATVWASETEIVVYPDAPNTQISYYDFESDGEGGVIAAWCYEDDDGSMDADVYAQRVAQDGSLLWTAGGVPVCTEADWQREVDISSDGAGGALIAWADLRTGVDLDIYVQRVDAAGAIDWSAAGGRYATTAAGPQYEPDIELLGSYYCVVAWTDNSGSDPDIYCAVKSLASGYNNSTTTGGDPVCTASGQQTVPRVVYDASALYNAYILWEDEREAYGYRDIYAQRINQNGDPQWTLNGVQLTDGEWDEWPYVADATLTGNLLVSWSEYYATGSELYVQEFKPDSTEVWDEGGVLVCVAEHGRSQSRAVSDGAGGIILTWADARDNYDSYVYAQRIGRRGNWGGFAPRITAVSDIANDQGGKIRVSWYRSAEEEILDNGVTQYSVWRRLDDIYSMPVLSGAVEVPGAGERPDAPVILRTAAGYVWEWLETIPAGFFEEYAYTAQSLYDSTGADPGLQYFMVRAHSADPGVFYDSPVESGYSVDDLSPSAPSGMIAERSFTPEGLSLTWDTNTEDDLAHYNVYRGLAGDFTPDAGTLLASPGEAAWFDAEWTWDSDYWYKVSAVDVHGNESDFALSAPGEVTGDDPRPLPEQDFLAQNYPNPFNPRTEISFGLSAAAHVTIRIFDASGRLVRTLVDRGMPAGRHSESWDGRDDLGNVAASGVYFYRLSAGDYQRTRKMVLLR